MPHGSRIVLLSALALTGCHTAERQPNPLLPPKPVVNSPTADAGKKPTPATPMAATGRAGTYSPVVRNENFQRPIAESPTPQPGVMPAPGVPTLPTTSYPAPAPSAEITPMTPPGVSGGTIVPPTADGGTGDLKVPSMFGTK